MRKSCFFFCALFISITAFSQQAVIDSLKNELTKATTNEKKVEALGMLSRIFMNVNLEQADKYGLQMTEVAEASRDRKLMIKAMLANGERYSYLSARQENIVKATGFYNNALEMAKKNKLDEQVITALLALSEISRSVPDADKALNYCNQAFGYTGTVKNDSLLARVHLEYGSVYLFKNEKILALKNLMAAIRLAEDLKNPQLLRAGYTKLSGFYSNIEDYDKAIDYQAKALDKLDDIKNAQAPYARLQDLIKLGDLYTAKKSYDIAMTYYEQAIAKADTLKFAPLKGVACRSIASCYMSSNQPKKALAYFNEHPEYADFLKTMNLSYFTDQFYGYIYAELGKYDSAKYYYDRIKNFMDTEGNSSAQISYYYGLGLLHKKTGEHNKAIDYFLKTKQLTEKIGELESQRMVVAELDTLYQRTGNYKLALDYAALNRKFKDSADKLGKEKDLLQIEVADEQQRQERIEKEKAEQKRKRDNIQYMMIIIGITSLFITMVMLGMFKVSATTIKLVGFFTFLMFFEFLFLVLKKSVYGFTKGEPWKDLLFMILLAAILLPLHHWMEHKVIHYLTSHNRLTGTGKGLLDKILKRKKEAPLKKETE